MLYAIQIFVFCPLYLTFDTANMHTTLWSAFVVIE